MSLRRLSLLPFCLLAGCQLWPGTESAPVPSAPQSRVQGLLMQQDGQWQLRRCNSSQALTLQLDDDLRQQFDELGSPTFADLGGRLEQNESQLRVQRSYRLQPGSEGCDDPHFATAQLRAAGEDPQWRVEVENDGLLLRRSGQPLLALPYMEEQMPDGRFALSSQADGLHLELWLAPQDCVDPRSGAHSHLSAQLRLNGQTQNGCGYFGGARRP